MLDADDETLKRMKSETGHSTSPSTGKIVTLGHESFKVNYFSALLRGKRL